MFKGGGRPLDCVWLNGEVYPGNQYDAQILWLFVVLAHRSLNCTGWVFVICQPLVAAPSEAWIRFHGYCLSSEDLLLSVQVVLPIGLIPVGQC